MWNHPTQRLMPHQQPPPPLLPPGKRPFLGPLRVPRGITVTAVNRSPNLQLGYQQTHRTSPSESPKITSLCVAVFRLRPSQSPDPTIPIVDIPGTGAASQLQGELLGPTASWAWDPWAPGIMTHGLGCAQQVGPVCFWSGKMSRPPSPSPPYPGCKTGLSDR